ncbi:MAG TPA: XrtA-associated tyrosine autokinase [Casimicrobiaceae bacterium]|nr:XrtA-associated tyrosine autokinase [Casimicrobiaceae bacterium]
MDLVEKAAQRLAQLKKAGIDTPTPEGTSAEGALAKKTVEAIPTPERLAQALTRAAGSTDRRGIAAEPTRTVVPTMPAQLPGDSAGAIQRSKVVDIDLEALTAAGFVTPQAQSSQIADEFRVIKRPIIRNAHAKSGTRAARSNLVMVTSAVPGEGKSFVALNLAMSIALEVDSTVLLVDADVANPSLVRLTHVPEASKGLLDLLTSRDVTLPDVLLKTNVDKLSLLPSGTAHGRATEMLASENMASLVDEMATRYSDRILVFDSPPLLATTEARALASHMGQIILVVEADRTTQALVKHALETVEACPVVMMVLNKAPRPEVGSYYGHHYAATAAAS